MRAPSEQLEYERMLARFLRWQRVEHVEMWQMGELKGGMSQGWLAGMDNGRDDE